MRIRLFLILAAVTLMSVGAAASPALAGASEEVAFRFLVCSDAEPGVELHGPCAAQSSTTGDVIEVDGDGFLEVRMRDDGEVRARRIVGNGSFLHMSAEEGNVSGVWVARKLLDFVPFGTSPSLPETFEGGVATLRIRLFPSFGGHVEGILRIVCLIGEPVPGEAEGIQLDIRGIDTFDQTLPGGETLFIRQPEE